jgi:hypothetical protein
VKFEVLVGVSIMVTVFWHITLCRLVHRYQHFGGSTFFPKTMAPVYQTTCAVPQETNPDIGSYLLYPKAVSSTRDQKMT